MHKLQIHPATQTQNHSRTNLAIAKLRSLLYSAAFFVSARPPAKPERERCAFWRCGHHEPPPFKRFEMQRWMPCVTASSRVCTAQLNSQSFVGFNHGLLKQHCEKFTSTKRSGGTKSRNASTWSINQRIESRGFSIHTAKPAKMAARNSLNATSKHLLAFCSFKLSVSSRPSTPHGWDVERRAIGNPFRLFPLTMR